MRLLRDLSYAPLFDSLQKICQTKERFVLKPSTVKSRDEKSLQNLLKIVRKK